MKRERGREEEREAVARVGRSECSERARRREQYTVK